VIAAFPICEIYALRHKGVKSEVDLIAECVNMEIDFRDLLQNVEVKLINIESETSFHIEEKRKIVLEMEQLEKKTSFLQYFFDYFFGNNEKQLLKFINACDEIGRNVKSDISPNDVKNCFSLIDIDVLSTDFTQQVRKWLVDNHPDKHSGLLLFERACVIVNRLRVKQNSQIPRTVSDDNDNNKNEENEEIMLREIVQLLEQELENAKKSLRKIEKEHNQELTDLRSQLDKTKSQNEMIAELMDNKHKNKLLANSFHDLVLNVCESLFECGDQKMLMKIHIDNDYDYESSVGSFFIVTDDSGLSLPFKIYGSFNHTTQDILLRYVNYETEPFAMMNIAGSMIGDGCVLSGFFAFQKSFCAPIK
jgi:hypothetical protein